MIIFDANQPRRLLQRLDPRARIVVAAGWIGLTCCLDRLPLLLTGLICALMLITLSGLPFAAVWRRLRHLNMFLAILLGFLPFSTPGEALFTFGPLSWSREGLDLACLIALRANSIVLACTALLGTMESAHLGVALVRLGLPEKLSHLFLFMIRYAESIHREYHRMRDALRLRGFRVGCNRHTLRTLGYLIGMLLVRSADKAERVLEAMKCRGFRGQLFVLEHFTMTRGDYSFVALAFSFFIMLGFCQWT